MGCKIRGGRRMTHIKLKDSECKFTHDGNITTKEGLYIPKEAVKTTIGITGGLRVLYLTKKFNYLVSKHQVLINLS